MEKRDGMLSVFIILFIIVLGVVFAQETTGDLTKPLTDITKGQLVNGEKTNLGKIVGDSLKEDDILLESYKEGEKVSFEKEDEKTRIYSKSDFLLKIKNEQGKYNEYTGFSKDNENTIVLDKDGKVVKADLKIDDKEGGTNLNVGNLGFNAPAGSNVVINEQNKDLVEVRVPKDSKIEKDPEVNNSEGDSKILKYISLDGESVLPGGQKFKGTLNHNGENYFLGKGKEAVIDKVKVKNVFSLAKNVNENLNIYFKEGEFKDNYAFFGRDKFLTGSKNSMDGNSIEFLAGNKYIEVGENSHFSLVPFANSVMSIDNGKFTHVGSGIFQNDYKSYLLSTIKGNLFLKEGLRIPGFDPAYYENKLQAGFEYLPYISKGVPVSADNSRLIFDNTNKMKMIGSNQKDEDVGRVQENHPPVDSGGKAVVGTDSKVSTGNLNSQDYPARGRSGLTGAFGDVMDHAPQPGELNYDSNNYDNPATKAHEETHGINANIGNTVYGDGTRVRGFYLLDGKKAVLKGPNVRIDSTKNYLPDSMKGGMYYDYLKSGSYTDDPLYVFDEWSSYLNGGRTAVDMASKGMWKWERGDAVAGPATFGMYSLALGMSVRENDPNYWKSQDGEQFRAFTKYNLERTIQLFNEGKKFNYLTNTQVHQQSENMLNQLRDTNNPQTEAMRNFAKQSFGSDWTKRVLGF